MLKAGGCAKGHRGTQGKQWKEEILGGPQWGRSEDRRYRRDRRQERQGTQGT